MAKNVSMCVRFQVNRTQIFMLIFINFIVAPEKVFLISFPVWDLYIYVGELLFLGSAAVF